MDAIPSFETIFQTAGQWFGLALETGRDWLAAALAVELPIPDAALLCAFALILYAVRANAQGSVNSSLGDVEAVYQAELLTANRRAQQARGDLQRAKKEIERERQKRRREARGEMRGRARKPSRIVELTQPAKSQVRQLNA